MSARSRFVRICILLDCKPTLASVLKGSWLVFFWSWIVSQWPFLGYFCLFYDIVLVYLFATGGRVFSEVRFFSAFHLSHVYPDRALVMKSHRGIF